MPLRAWMGLVAAGALSVGLVLSGGALAAAELPAQKSPSPQPAKPQPAEPKAPAKVKPSVERVHVEAGVVTVTTYPKATGEDLGVPKPPGAVEKESGAWRLKPPQGAESLLAIGTFTSTRSLDELEQFYRKALGQPEVRRGGGKGQTLIVLSRVQGAESIIIRVSRSSAAKAATITIRRAIQGAPVEIEPTGPPGLRRRGEPRAPRGAPA